MFFSSRNWWKRTYWQRSYFWGKKTKSTRKKLGFKFIGINTSKTKNDYHLDFEVVTIKSFVVHFKNKKIKEREKKLIEAKKIREQVEKEMREKIEKEMREKIKKELEDKNKNLNNQLNY